jgi:hypothetical protein
MPKPNSRTAGVLINLVPFCVDGVVEGAATEGSPACLGCLELPELPELPSRYGNKSGRASRADLDFGAWILTNTSPCLSDSVRTVPGRTANHMQITSWQPALRR